jgi:cholesterol oxidase
MQTFDYIVIGSGFGGSVSALRLTQKGYRVAVLEEGRRWSSESFPQNTWDAKNYLWFPRLGCTGIQRVDLLDHALVVSGAGVGGGSLVYGNTLIRPLDSFFQRQEIARLGGKETLLPFYEEAERMMGVVDNPRLFEPDHLLKRTAETYGRGDTFRPSPVGVCFAEPGQEVEDPYFQGRGPRRKGCTFCGGCFVGCRIGAKNSLDKNYLYLAERAGAHVLSQTKVTSIRPIGVDGAQGYRLETQSTPGKAGTMVPYRAKGVIVAAGVLGTAKLLLHCKKHGFLPRLSHRLGHDVRTNSEVIIGVRSRRDVDYSQGIAASSSIFIDEHTQIQADRYPAGSDTMALLTTLLVDGGGRIPRWLRLAGGLLRHPRDLPHIVWPKNFATRSMILVVMQDYESSLRLVSKRQKLRSEVMGNGNEAYIPIANDFARRLAKQMDGVPLSSLSEVLLNRPATAHILGGCIMGKSPDEGVIDDTQKVFGYRNLMICDGSVVPANLGVNPALSILALSERAMSLIPPKAT